MCTYRVLLEIEDGPRSTHRRFSLNVPANTSLAAAIARRSRRRRNTPARATRSPFEQHTTTRCPDDFSRLASLA